ncbi:MAG: STAS domain-containing protein [Micromonospora sp.]
MSLSITSAIRSGGVVVLFLRGPLRRADVDAFRGALGDVLRTHRPLKMELDLSGLLDIEPGAAGAVTEAAREALRRGTAVAVVHSSTAVRQQLRMAGGESLLT